jgi:hypothetical protein
MSAHNMNTMPVNTAWSAERSIDFRTAQKGRTSIPFAPCSADEQFASVFLMKLQFREREEWQKQDESRGIHQFLP